MQDFLVIVDESPCPLQDAHEIPDAVQPQNRIGHFQFDYTRNLKMNRYQFF